MVEYFFQCTHGCGETSVENDPNYHLKNNCLICEGSLKFIGDSTEDEPMIVIPRMHRGQSDLVNRIN
jgi:hypothetical protein